MTKITPHRHLGRLVNWLFNNLLMQSNPYLKTTKSFYLGFFQVF